MAHPDITPATTPPGQILTYYGDIASGAVRPEDMRFEGLTYRAIIDATGLVVAQTAAINVVSTYNLALRSFVGEVINPDLAGAAAGLVKWNFKEQGRNFTVFKQPRSLGACIVNPTLYDGVYMCVPGTTLECEWTIDTTLWPVLVGATRVVQITANGDYIRCGPGSR